MLEHLYLVSLAIQILRSGVFFFTETKAMTKFMAVILERNTSGVAQETTLFMVEVMENHISMGMMVMTR